MTHSPSPSRPVLGVGIVLFNSADVILDCLESLIASAAATDTDLRIVLCDNASTDDTLDTLRQWATGALPYTAPNDIPFPLTASSKPIVITECAPGPHLPAQGQGHITLIDAGVNAGFAAGVNRCVEALASDPAIDTFWVLNPDSVVAPGTPATFLAAAATSAPFSLMGGRVCYLDPPDRIQIDGGTLHRWTGVTGNLNLGQSHTTTPYPDAASLDFITGASMIVSRSFYETAGPMTEDYFLYYEEVDWAMRRGDLPLAYCRDGLVYHKAGTAIGSPTLERVSSPFSMYLKTRARMRFVARFNAKALPVAMGFALGKAAQALLKGAPASAWAAVAGALFLGPPKAVRARLSPEAARLAFGHDPKAS